MPPSYITPNEKTVTRPCRQCDEPFTTRLALVKRGEGFYCTMVCKIAHQRAVAARQVAARFWSKVDRSGGPDACWPWLASCFDNGYGQFKVGIQNRKAHRVAWELVNGSIPKGMLMMHAECDNPPCCNPAHLKPGTNAENSQDMVSKGRQGKQANTGRVHNY